MAYLSGKAITRFAWGKSIQLFLAIGILSVASLTAGCSRTSFQIVENQTGKPLPGVRAKLIRQRTLFEEVITAPGTLTVSVKESDDAGRVRFRVPADYWIDFRSPEFHVIVRMGPDGKWQYEGDALWVRADEMTGDVTVGANLPHAISTAPNVLRLEKVGFEQCLKTMRTAVDRIL